MNSRTQNILWISLALTVVTLVLPQPSPCQAQLTLEFKITDKDVDQAIERLQNCLWMRQRDDGSWDDVVGQDYQRWTGGTTALVVLAMLESGIRLNDSRMDKALDNLLSVEMKDAFCRSLRVMAISRAYRLAQRRSFAECIVKDMQFLTTNLPREGAWDYRGPSKVGNNTTSQYGLLSLWEADLAGFDENRVIPKLMPTKENDPAAKTPAPATTPTPAKTTPAPAKTPTAPTTPGKAPATPAATTPAVAAPAPPLDIAAAWPIIAKNMKDSWPAIEQVWVKRQRPDNGWTYAAIAKPEVESTETMTAAGVASLYIIIDKAYAPQMTPGKPRPKTEAFDRADKGMAWLSERLKPGFTSDGYLAFGIQRIAEAGGLKYVGKHEWFQLGVKEIADRASNAPKALEGPHGPDMQAANYLLFLSRGRVPVTFNKLRRAGTDWDAAPRDIARLTRYLVGELEIPMTWQIVDADRPVAEFLDAPILFINGIKPVATDKAMVDKMREYVLRGGLVVGEATTNSGEFVNSFKKLLELAFPEGSAAGAETYVWKEMKPQHPILAALTEKDLQQVGPVWHMDDAVRTVAVLLTRDHATAWQHMDVVKKEHCFKIGRNLFTYATAQEPLKTRLRPVFAGRTINAENKKTVGILPVGTRWLSDVYAVERLSDRLAMDARIMVDMDLTADPAALDPKQCPMIWIYGQGLQKLPDDQVAALKSFVTKGGLVLVSANMGSTEFFQSAKALAKQLLPDAVSSPILEKDPIFTGLVYRERGKKINPTEGLTKALRTAGGKGVELTGYQVDERWGVVVCPHDMFMPMLGSPVYGCRGYTAEMAQQLAANVFLYAMEKVETPAPKGNAQ